MTRAIKTVIRFLGETDTVFITHGYLVALIPGHTIPVVIRLDRKLQNILFILKRAYN